MYAVVRVEAEVGAGGTARVLRGVAAVGAVDGVAAAEAEVEAEAAAAARGKGRKRGRGGIAKRAAAPAAAGGTEQASPDDVWFADEFARASWPQRPS
eukprot:scaffold5987_cov122-Isochrysis_galbana.AAC.2